MTTRARHWAVRLTATAEDDFRGILGWTVQRFGEQQARIYAKTLTNALEALSAGPGAIGVTARDDIAQGLFALHVARRGRKGRHFIMFRIGAERDQQVIEVLRFLHDAMDLPRHVRAADESG